MAQIKASQVPEKLLWRSNYYKYIYCHYSRGLFFICRADNGINNFLVGLKMTGNLCDYDAEVFNDWHIKILFAHFYMETISENPN